MMQHFFFFNFVGVRSLTQRLETVDPKGLMMEEKLAFWINLLNAMIMHVRVSLLSILLYFTYQSILVPDLTDLIPNAENFLPKNNSA